MIDFNYRVDTDYYSREYDDRMLETSAPYKTLEEAEKAYIIACAKFCIDKPDQPARVKLSRYEWATLDAPGVEIPIKQNYISRGLE